MKVSGNTVLITGGATGIGFALAEHLLKSKNEVVICGRREDKLAEAKKRLPGLQTRRCDVSDRSDRKALFDWVMTKFNPLNILINNAGIQKNIDFTRGAADLESGDSEIAINLEAPICLSAMFVPELIQRNESAIVNISSGLGFVPMAFMPIYCATKAGIHSWSLSLRWQLRETAVKVFEIIPPMVDTELDRGARDRRGQKDRGISPIEVARATLSALDEEEFEMAIGQAQFLRKESRADPKKVFHMLNDR